ncbi:MAG: hypothetical protein QOI07_1532 [Verrucomicrobiota bacterium]|jgi:hypothetical protein
MKPATLWLPLFAILLCALLVSGAKSPAPQIPGLPASVFTTPAPPPTPTPRPVASPSEQRIALAQPPPADSNAPPKPVLYLMGMEPFSAGGKNYIRLFYDVLNKAEYPADMFAAAPALPPCGSNTNASRTWVDFFSSTGQRIYGFCALSKPADLGKIWIAYEEGTIPPSYVYIELNDRQTNTKYKSNLADTTL